MLDQQRYMIDVYESKDGDGALVFAFVPNGLQQARGPGGAPKRVQQYIASVRGTPDALDFDWSGSPDDPGTARPDMQDEIRVRMQERAVWIDRVSELVERIDQWAKELGWSTRRLEKRLDDARVGNHRVHALLMQAETVRILLEPIGRSAPGAEGVVDLYLMPGYDDIASIYYHGGHWNLHYVFPDRKVLDSGCDTEGTLLSKEALGAVLAEMTQHAA